MTTTKNITIEQALDLVNSHKSEINGEIIEAIENFEESEEITLYSENVALSTLEVGEKIIIINGNLKVDKIIEDDEFTLLIVLGDVQTTSLITLADIRITGNLTVENIILGDSSNDCQLIVGGNLRTKTIIEGGHWFVVKGVAKVDYLYNSHCNLTDKNGKYKPNLADGDLMYDFNESPESYKGFSYVEMIDDIQENGDHYNMHKTIEFIKNGGTKFHK